MVSPEACAQVSKHHHPNTEHVAGVSLDNCPAKVASFDDFLILLAFQESMHTAPSKIRLHADYMLRMLVIFLLSPV